MAKEIQCPITRAEADTVVESSPSTRAGQHHAPTSAGMERPMVRSDMSSDRFSFLSSTGVSFCVYVWSSALMSGASRLFVGGGGGGCLDGRAGLCQSPSSQSKPFIVNLEVTREPESSLHRRAKSEKRKASALLVETRFLARNLLWILRRRLNS